MEPVTPHGLKCPSCGAPMEITFLGEARDKVALCAHCGTVVDLPDRRGTTREKVTEQHGVRVTERVTTWESDLPPDVRSFLEGVLQSGGEPLSDLELRRRIRDELPAELADRLLVKLDGGEVTTREIVSELLRFRFKVTKSMPDGAVRVQLGDREFSSLDELGEHLAVTLGRPLAQALVGLLRTRTKTGTGTPRQSSARRRPAGPLARLRRLLGG